jgi:hypothetical protein
VIEPDAVRQSVLAEQLSLPQCGSPRPGSFVVWYEGSMPLRGTLLGQNIRGKPCMDTPYGITMFAPDYDAIRLEDPAHQGDPNWSALSPSGQILRPTEGERRRLDELLDQTVPPGPRHIDLINEIWFRGYEVFVVGGTVRDVIAGKPAKDVDIATTMPMQALFCLVKCMYRAPQKLDEAACRNGHLRLGGRRGTSDPFLDICVFKHHLPGTAEAVFGASFDHDIWFRDFACNSIYYDPVNQVFVDPTGYGLDDATTCTLRTVYNSQLRTPYHVGRVAVRTIKFYLRGFTNLSLAEDDLRKMLNCMSALTQDQRIAYMRSQIFAALLPQDRVRAFDAVREAFVQLNALPLWESLFVPHREELLR